MSYTVTVNNGPSITVPIGGLDTSTSVTLIGKDYPNYGEIIAQNFIDMVQNFAGSTQPNGVLTGQLWFDTNTKLLKVYDGLGFHKIAVSTTVSTGAPSNPNQGDLWYDSDDIQLKVYDGALWVSIGPAPTITTNIISETILDISSNSYEIARLAVNNTNVAVFSSSAFTPQGTYAGLNNIINGLYVSNNLTVNNDANITNNLTVNQTLYAKNIAAVSGSINLGNTLTGTTVQAATIGNVGSNLLGTFTGTSIGTHNGPTNGPLNGTIGATTPNAASFTSVAVGTTLDVIGISNLTGNINAAAAVNAASVQASNIGNTGATITGSINTAGVTESVVALGTVTTSSTLTISSATVVTATLTASTACTFTMPAATAGKSFTLFLRQAAVTGNGSATFTGVKWAGSAPTVTTIAGRMDIFSFIADGSNWYGTTIQGFVP